MYDFDGSAKQKLLSAVQILREAGATVNYPSEWDIPVPEEACSRCGMPESATEWNTLVDVEVIVANGQEGHADILQLFCDQCFEDTVEQLVKLGFYDHNHGTINYLENEKCPGYDDMTQCPTPSEYGLHVVQPNEGRAYLT